MLEDMINGFFIGLVLGIIGGTFAGMKITAKTGRKE